MFLEIFIDEEQKIEEKNQRNPEMSSFVEDGQKNIAVSSLV